MKEESSFRQAEEILEEKGLLGECRKIASPNCEENPKELGWKTEEIIEIKAPERNLNRRYDFFKNGAALSHEKIEQMRARWHLMKMEIGFRKGKVDVGVLIFPEGEDCSLQRAKRELNSDLWNKYFPIEVPIHVIEYSEELEGR